MQQTTKPMTVEQLIKKLEKIENKKRIVVMSRDAEGNGYSPLSGFWEASYKAETTWSGEVGLEKLTKADEKAGYSEEDVLKGTPALVLTPIN